MFSGFGEETAEVNAFTVSIPDRVLVFSGSTKSSIAPRYLSVSIPDRVLVFSGLTFQQDIFLYLLVLFQSLIGF